jgi:hypothetical protein
LVGVVCGLVGVVCGLVGVVWVWVVWGVCVGWLVGVRVGVEGWG